jgi:hypothetical protein
MGDLIKQILTYADPKFFRTWTTETVAFGHASRMAASSGQQSESQFRLQAQQRSEFLAIPKDLSVQARDFGIAVTAADCGEKGAERATDSADWHGGEDFRLPGTP